MKWKASAVQENKSYDWSKSSGAGNQQHKQHKVYRLACLLTGTIFSIYLLVLTKHCVSEVYQTLSHPHRLQGEFNHLICWDTRNLSPMDTQNIHTGTKCPFWISLLFTQATRSIFCHVGMTQWSKTPHVSYEGSWFQKQLALCLKEIPFKWTNVRRGLQLSVKGGWILH